MSLLPPPPLRIQASIFTRAILLSLISIAMLTLMGWYATTDLPRETAGLLRERAVWQHGVPAEDGSYQGEVSTSRFVFHSFKMTVSYTDQAGDEHAGKLEFSSLGAALDDGAPTEIRYDPDRPGEFALGKALDIAGARWASIAFFAVMSVVLVLLFGFLLARILHDLRRTLACARDGEAVEVEILSVSTPDQHGNATYKYRVAGGRAEGKPHRVVLQGLGPIHVGGDRKRALAVQSQNDRRAAVLLRADGYPFSFPPEVRDALLEAARTRTVA